MDASTTRKTSASSNANERQGKGSSRLRSFTRSPSTLDGDEFYEYLQQQYGAVWGTFKFEDSLSDYTNEVFILSYLTIIPMKLFRLDRFSTLMIISIYMIYIDLCLTNGILK